MGIGKGPTEGGSGGKRGHSRMEHWLYSDEVKDSSRLRRRLNDKREVQLQLDDLEGHNQNVDRK